MEEIQLKEIENVVKVMAETAIANERYFSDLDAKAGDADFGTSLAAGFRAILNQWDAIDRSSIASFLTKVSMIITGNVGGCSGPIWGTAFMRAGIKSKGRNSLTLSDIVVMFRSAIEGIIARGGAELGDKTLLDALIPSVDRLEEANEKGKNLRSAFEAAAAEAEAAIERTKDWEAKRGRQSFTGERSKGTFDPGIVAVATMFREVLKKGEKKV